MPPRNQPRELPAFAQQRPVTWAPYASPQPVLVAERARLHPGGGACVLCGWALLPGNRVADLTGGRGLAHVSCLGGRA